MKYRIALLIGLFFSCLPAASHAAQQQVRVGLNDVIATVERSFKAGSNGQAPVSDFTADFFQRTLLSKESREMRGDGVVSVKLATASSPLMYRFQYYRPYQQEIVSDGNSLWIYHPENREVILSDVSFNYNRPGFNPDRDRAVNFLQGLGRISKDFQINFASGMNDAAGNYVLELNPRHAMLNTRRILLVVSRDSVVSYVTGANPLTKGPEPDAPQSRALSTTRTPFGATAPFGGVQGFGVTSDPFPLLSSTVEDQEGNSTTMEFANIRINTRLSNTDFSFMIPPGVQVVKPSERNQPR
ncbi:MAG: outer membrane lipoprotein carrier protein LolA [Desulfuromonadaceae bacterium]